MFEFERPMRINGVKRRGAELWILELVEGEPDKRETVLVDGNLRNEGPVATCLREERRPVRTWFMPIFTEAAARDFGNRIGEWL